MILKKQVISIESSEKLYNFGLRMSSLFYWNEGDSSAGGTSFELTDEPYPDTENYKMYQSFPAYTSAELAELLPSYCEITYRNCSNDRKQIRWNCNNHFSETEASTMADAFAEMLVYLIKNKLYDPQTQKTQTTV